MKAVAYYQSLPIDRPEALVDLTLPEPTRGPRDLLVEVRAISVNPVDVKVRAGMPPVDGQPRVRSGMPVPCSARAPTASCMSWTNAWSA
jgi:NADPH:quinone reductase-like Zn-dependent oxidoreductase